MTLSVVILNWNRRDELRDCLNSVYAQQFTDFEVIVVDNHSNDGSVDMVAKEFPQARVLRLARNHGISGSNVGLRAAAGEFVINLDNDMLLQGVDAFAKVVQHFRDNPEVGSVAFRVIDAATGEESFNNPKHRNDGDNQRGYAASAFDGGGSAFRRSVLEQVGYFPEEFFMYQNEVDLSARIWDAGHEIRYFPDVTVAHRFAATARPANLYFYLWHRNYLWYFWKYYPADMAVVESLRFILLGFVSSCTHRYQLVWLKAVLIGLAGLPAMLRRRKPVRRETVEKMAAIRLEDHLRKKSLAASGGPVAETSPLDPWRNRPWL